MDFNDYVKQSYAFAQEKKFDLALENLEAALELQHDNANLQQMIEMVKTQNDLQTKRRQAAAKEAKLQAEISRDLYGITDVDNAITEYTRALEINPNDDQAKEILAWAYYTRGLTFDSEGKDTLAVGAYSEAINNMPKFPKAIKRRGYASLEAGDYDQAIKDFEEMKELEPEEPQWKERLATVYSNRGGAYDMKGDYENAVQDYKKAIELDPDGSATRELLKIAEAELAKK